MQEPELKTSIGWQIVERLLAINRHQRGPAAEFGESNKTLQNILTGKAFPASMWLCWRFNALSVVSTYF